MNGQALAFISEQLLKNNRDALGYDDVISLLQGAPQPLRVQFIAALRRGRTQQLGNIVTDLVADTAQSNADKRANDMLIDNTLTEAEIDEIFK